MDGTITDFFNEIDQIAPPKERKSESVWQECVDNNSGYSYYWNIKTDQVTWEMPEEYKLWKEQNTLHKSGNLYVPPKSTPLFPSTAISTTKIYKIQEDSQNLTVDERKSTIQMDKQVKKSHKSSNNSDEKIVLISSYGDDSESESDTEKPTEIVPVTKNSSTVLGPHFPDDVHVETYSNASSRSNSDSEEDIDLLTQIQNRAKVLKDLGGELPPDVRKLVENEDSIIQKELPQNNVNKEKKDVTGFSLLAGYGDSEEEEDEIKVSLSVPSENKTSHSTLFPISKPIDVTQFIEVKKESETPEPQKVIDSRVFHRKRRIGVDLVNKKAKVGDASLKCDGIEVERQGLGFKSESEGDQNVSKHETKVDYPGFKSGGLMFIKSDMLTPTIEPDKKEVLIKEDIDESKNDIMLKIEETRKTLNEKLTFLSEGRELASPVQIMIIQMETLYEAVKAGSLTMNYLYKWLKETCSELVKLEKDAAPSGWLLQWDRINKRYYYRNQQTGDSQWEYPQPDIVGGDEAMDISTTPPPPSADDVLPLEPTALPMRPPPPPRIKSPTPPPPPSISAIVKQQKKESATKSHSIPPLPPDIAPHLPPLPVENLSTHGEPLPPGVDSPEIASLPPSSVEDMPQTNSNDILGSALNSFYSDLAAMETEAPTISANDSVSQPTENIAYTEVNQDISAKKKKKMKVKLVQGLAMKKKGVSKLVERWKNVQKDY